jgi:hypothetical protein
MMTAVWPLQEYYYQRGREEVHRRTNDSTNYRVMLTSVLEAIALVGCSVVQVSHTGPPSVSRQRKGAAAGCGVDCLSA